MRLPAFARTGTGATGLAILALVVGVALLGPLFAPHGVNTPIGIAGQGPQSGSWLGTDNLGRDVLSRVLHGGVTVFWMGTAATLLAYGLGLTVGLTAGYARNVIDPILMRTVDILVAFPALLLVLLLVSGLGTHVLVVIGAVALAVFPGVARIARTATLEVATRGFVEAAEARGEPARYILRHEIGPNILPVILADFGIRYGYSIVLIAGVNYLGLGLQPPTADWGLMISENQAFISLNAWAVLAPAVMLALLTIGVNLVADAYVGTLGKTQQTRIRRASIRTRLIGGPT
jgi:peptide/nickel transport system permease protein